MLYGINNFKINNVKGTFTNAFVGKVSSSNGGVKTICVDDYAAENNIQFIDILHSDIQGFEYDMLLGAAKTIYGNKVGYVFISTHGNDVHYKCLDFLQSNGFKILCSANEHEIYSLDGLIVARSKHYKGIEKIKILLKEQR